MKKLFFLTAMMFSSVAFSQEGVNTSTPKATFDITAKNSTGTNTNVDGFLVPRIDRQRAQSMTSIPSSTFVYINDVSTGSQTGYAVNVDATGYYYFDGNVWIKLNPTAGNDINIYNADGTLTENRIVKQEGKTLTFTGTLNNAFSIDGTTFSVDAASNKVGIGTTTPNSILEAHTHSAGGLIDAFSAGINNCGTPCGQGTARNIALFNANGTNSQFASIDFIPSNIISEPQLTGASIKGIDRDTENGYAGIQFSTRNQTDLNARMTIKSAGNVGMGTSAPHENALLDVYATDKGFLPPRMTTAQRDAINPKPAGLLIYNTSLNEMQYWNNSTWIKFAYQ
jgi:hypothetical protein